MNLAEKFQTSWELMKSSLRVVRDHPRLALFPVVSAIFTVLLAAFFFVPVAILAVQSPAGQAWLAGHSWAGDSAEEAWDKLHWVFYSYGTLIYLVSLFVATFFNVAFYNEIMRALAGQEVSVGHGLRFARGKLRSILLWSLLAGIVGVIIRAIEERLGWVGKMIMAFLGTAWSVAAVFAIPVIIRREESNPLAVLRDSALTLKQTWGESLVGYVGIHLAGLAVVLAVGVSILVLVIFSALTHAWWLTIGGAVVMVPMMLAAFFFINLANHVYRCALYIYASEGVVPEPFTAGMMNAAWKVKKA